MSLNTIILLSICVVASSSYYDPYYYYRRYNRNYGYQRQTPSYYSRLNGPNTCRYEEVPGSRGDDTMYTERKTTRDVCGKRMKLETECCTGYKEDSYLRGCKRTYVIRNIMDTLKEDLKLNKFPEAMIKMGMEEDMKKRGAYTVFAFSNEAYDEMNPSDVKLDADTMLYHTANERINITAVNGASQMITRTNERTTLHVKHYKTGETMVNCARVVKPNINARNGVIHVIDGVLNPTPGTLADVIDGKSKFSEFSKILRKAHMTVEMAKDGPFTVFAPTNKAVEKMPSRQLNRILQNPDALKAVVKAHIMNGIYCAKDLEEGQNDMKTIGGSMFNLKCLSPPGIRINQAKIKDEDMMASNGVLHEIDQVLLPPEAEDVYDRLQDLKLNKFREDIGQAGLENTFGGKGPLTVFAPTDDAFRDPKVKKYLKTNSLNSLLLHHIAHGLHTMKKAVDNDNISTKDTPSIVRVEVYRKKFGVENACVERKDIKTSNGVIHVVNKVLIPTKKTLIEVIRERTDLATFAKVLEKDPELIKMLSTPSHVKPECGHKYTLFAPNNVAFRRHPHTVRRLMNHPAEINKVMKNHIMEDVYSTCAFPKNEVIELEMMGGKMIDVKNYGTRIKFGPKAWFEDRDILASNGIIHIVDCVFDH